MGLLEREPCPFYVAVVQGHVRVVPVHPHAQILKFFVHCVNVLCCESPAFFNEFFDSEFFDFLFVF